MSHNTKDGLSGIVEAQEPKSIQDWENAGYISRSKLEGILKRYNAVVKHGGCYEPGFLDGVVLTPAQISTFIKITEKRKHDADYGARKGRFLTGLVQKSYDAGYNNFMLDLSGPQLIRDIGDCLKGTEHNRLKIRITGDIGDWCAVESSYCDFKIEGDVGQSLARYAKHSSFAIKGDAGFGLGEDAVDSDFYVEGNLVGAGAIESKNCRFSLLGTAPWTTGGSSKGCSFKTNNLQTLLRLYHESYCIKELVYIHKDGSEEMVIG